MVLTMVSPKGVGLSIPLHRRVKFLEVCTTRVFREMFFVKEVWPWIGVCDSFLGVEFAVEMIRPRMHLINLVCLVVVTLLVSAGREGNAPRQMIADVIFNRRDAGSAVVVNVRIVFMLLEVAWREVSWTSDGWCGSVAQHGHTCKAGGRPS